MDTHDRTIPERLAAIEVKIDLMCKRTLVLDEIVPLVKENSWWIGKIKWGFVFITVVAVIGGLVTLAIRS
jgi:hypothetical protein